MACELALLALGCSLYSLFYVLWHFACVYVCVRVSGPLELELSRELLYGSWDWTWVLWECSQCFYLLSRLPVPVFTLSLLFFNFEIFTLCLWVLCLHVCMCTMCMPGVQAGQRRVSGLLEPELQVDVNHHARC